MQRLCAAVVVVVVAMAGCAHKKALAPAPEFSDPMAQKTLERLSEDYWDFEMRRNPIWATYLSDRRFDEELPDLTPDGHARDLEQAAFLYKQARELDPNQLAAEDRITREVMLTQLEGFTGSEVCKALLWDVNALDGVQTTLGELPSLHGITEKKHADALVVRYQKSGDLLDQHVGNLRTGMERGYLATKVAVRRVLEQLDAMLSAAPEQSSFVTEVKLPEGWEQKDKDEVRGKLVAAVKEKLYPGLTRYRDFLKNEYLAKARDQVGVKFNKDGEACYRARIFASTHLKLTPDEIHEIGLQQAEQNLRDMKAIAQRVNGSEDLEALKAHWAKDPAQHVKTREELMAYATELIARANAKVPEVFGRLPRQQVKVKAIESFREASSPTGYYYSASEAENRPGYFYLNTYEPETRVLYLMQSLTFHETVPGHHLQGALAQEIPSLPRFRREMGSGEFTEGWAHYAELLADELGLYDGDAGRFGMLSDQALRAVRLVVDTGMHAKGWTREQALDYAVAHTAEPRPELEREIDRYIVWPGQALSYKLGQLEILKRRKDAQEKLGARFDVKAFHDELLRHGSVPLPVMNEFMGEWLAREAVKQ